METVSALLAICAGNSLVPGEFPAQRPVARSFDVFFVLRLNKRLSKQSWGWWFRTLSCPLWRHCNGFNFRSSQRFHRMGIFFLKLNYFKVKPILRKPVIRYRQFQCIWHNYKNTKRVGDFKLQKWRILISRSNISPSCAVSPPVHQAVHPR